MFNLNESGWSSARLDGALALTYIRLYPSTCPINTTCWWALCCPELELVSIFIHRRRPCSSRASTVPCAFCCFLTAYLPHRFLSGKGFYLLLHLANGIQLLISSSHSQAPPMLHHFSCHVLNDLQLHCCTDFCQGTRFLIFLSSTWHMPHGIQSVQNNMSLCAALDHDQLIQRQTRKPFACASAVLTGCRKISYLGRDIQFSSTCRSPNCHLDYLLKPRHPDQRRVKRHVTGSSCELSWRPHRTGFR
jgi:hypothetical protein